MTRALCTACLALMALLAACAGPAVDPGPNPARVALEIKRTLSAETVQTALQQQGPLPSRMTRLNNFLGPFWDIRAEAKQADGTWRRLPLAPGQQGLLDGYTLDTKRVFLAPPGRQELRLRLEAYISRSWEELVGDPYYYRRGPDGQLIREYNPNWRTQTENVYLLERKSSVTLELKAGQEVVIKTFK